MEETVDLPVAMEPVRPRRSIILNGYRAMQLMYVETSL